MSAPPLRAVWASLSLLLALACSRGAATSAPPSDDAGATPLADAARNDGPYPAPHAALPQVTSHGRRRLTSPTLIPVFFPNDPLEGQVLDFLGKLAASSYWGATLGEYSIGVPTVAPVVHVPSSPPTSISGRDVETWLEASLGFGPSDAGADGASSIPTSPLPPYDASSYYLLFFPESTSITFPGLKSCASYGGYHAGTVLNGVAYAVLPRCAEHRGLFGIDALTESLSHEIVEGATDPDPDGAPALIGTDFGGSGWALATGATGSELGDMCTFVSGAVVPLAGTPYVVQRTWSNAAALLGHDPCVPAPLGPAFGAAPDLADTVHGVANAPVLGVAIPPGQSRTIALRVFSDAPTTSPITVEVDQGDGHLVGADPDSLAFALDARQGVNGDVLHLTITRNPRIFRTRYHSFQITSTLEGRATTWFAMVGE